MNINDFVILPGSKTGTSVKLKAKNVRELQLEKVQLELENKEMEKKLQQLQSNMSREKEERRGSSGYRWESGQPGPMGIQPQVCSQNKENVKVSSRKMKLKILKEQIQEPVKQPFIHKRANLAAFEKPKTKGKTCGQCEIKTALLVCLECGEDYCGSCFARVHQKGALKLHRMIPFQAKTHVSTGKLEATDKFMKDINPDESKMNHEQKKANSKNQLTSGIFSSLLMPTGNAEETSETPTEAVFENQSDGLLLNGTFDEEESVASFQEALTQWRDGNHEDKKKQNSYASEPESMGVCEVQTNLTILRKPVKIEFKEDSLNYMEKLWLKKHRRTPVDQMPSLQTEEFTSKQELMNEAHDVLSGGEEGDNNDDDDLIVEDMKKYWTALFRTEESGMVRENLESSLKIEVLSDSFEEDLDESCSSVVMEVGSTELNNEKSGTVPENQKDRVSDILSEQVADVTSKTSLNSASTADKKDLLIPYDRSTAPLQGISEVSSARTSIVNHERIYTDCIHSSTEETVLSGCRESAITEKESIKTKSDRRSLSDCISPEKTFDLPELGSNEPSSMMRSLKDNKDSLEFNSFHITKSLVLPVTTEASVLLQRVALREKPTFTRYQGLEGFFILYANSKQVTLDSAPSPCSDCSSTDNSISVSGMGCWIRDASLSEFADDSVVQDVWQSELSRSSRSLGEQNLHTGILPQTLMHKASTDNHFQRPFSANMPSSKSMKCGHIHCTPSQKSLSNLTIQPLSSAAAEISKIECIDLTEDSDHLFEHTADQQALAALENELKSHTDPQEKHYSLPSGDLSAFSRHSKKISENITDFRSYLEIKDNSRIDIFRDCDESHTDEEEEILRDKQQVIALH